MEYFLHGVIYFLIWVDYIKLILCRHHYDRFLGVGEGTVSRYGAIVRIYWTNIQRQPTKCSSPDCALANGQKLLTW
jgi:hypothetical protein